MMEPTFQSTFFSEIGTALAILFVVAVATEILVETLRGLLSGFFNGVFQEPFFTSQTDLKTALNSVADMFPEDETDTKLMMMRLENAHQKAISTAKKKAKEVEGLVKQAKSIPDIASAKEAIHEDVSRLIADIDATERQRKIAIKVIAAIAGVVLCISAGIDAFAKLDFTSLGSIVGFPIGTILTGLGAAGGSNFWHDQIEKVRLVRSAAAIGVPAK